MAPSQRPLLTAQPRFASCSGCNRQRRHWVAIVFLNCPYLSLFPPSHRFSFFHFSISVLFSFSISPCFRVPFSPFFSFHVFCYSSNPLIPGSTSAAFSSGSGFGACCTGSGLWWQEDDPSPLSAAQVSSARLRRAGPHHREVCLPPQRLGVPSGRQETEGRVPQRLAVLLEVCQDGRHVLPHAGL